MVLPLLADYLPDFLKTWDKCGPFVAGTVFGCAVSMAMFHFASGERKARLKLDQEREREYRKQLDIKEKRIDALHDKLAQSLADRDAKPKTKK